MLSVKKLADIGTQVGRHVVRRSVVGVLVAATMVANPARATPVQVSNPFLQLYNVGINSDGFSSGQLIRFGGTSVIPNGSNGTTGYATTTNLSTGASLSYGITFDPGPSIPNFFTRNIAYSPNLIGPYTINFQNQAYSSYQTTLTLPTGATEVPFVNSIALSGTAQNPTFSWTPPAATTVNGYRVNIYDKALINTNSSAGPLNNGEVVTTNLLPSVRSYTVNAADFTVPNYVLTNGHQYSIEISVLQTRDGLSTNLGNTNVYGVSRVYADFTPENNASTPVVNLPVVLPNGDYQFNFAVQAAQLYYIDPSIAVGYNYRTGVGDPDFASVLLPTLQSAPFYVSFMNGGLLDTEAVLGGVSFAFPAGGVDHFGVTGIDPADRLDPGNTTAFVTGLTFVASGTFTGIQSPIVATSVPEPPVAALVAVGMAAFVMRRRTRRFPFGKA